MRWSLRPPPRYAAARPLPPEDSSLPPAETSDPPEDPDPDAWRKETRKFRPKWRRAWDWLTHAGRMVSIVAGICTSTVGLHAALKALELKHLVESTIKEEVTTQSVDIKARLENLESRMSGVPEWRGSTSTLDSVQNQRLQDLERRAESCEQQNRAFFALVSKGR